MLLQPRDPRRRSNSALKKDESQINADQKKRKKPPKPAYVFWSDPCYLHLSVADYLDQMPGMVALQAGHVPSGVTFTCLIR